MAKVILDKVVKVFGKTEVVHGVSLEIKNLEFVVLVGPSGCGKSTVLRMIAGLEQISAGHITIGDRVVNDIAPKDRRVAMVFQNYALYPHMNVYKNMSFGLKLRKLPKAEIDQRVQEAATILGLEDLLKRKPHELSGGQRQRVAMGRAIVRNPSVFLFDEPLSNLDAKLRTQMRTEIKRLHQKVQSTIVYVTHDQVEAMTLADRIVVMRDGNIEQVGAPLEVFENPTNAFVAGFIGSPPMNLVPAKIQTSAEGFELYFNERFAIPIPAKPQANLQEGMAVISGLRPEALTLPNGAQAAQNLFFAEGVVDVAEPLGSETLIHVDFEGAKFIAKSEGRKIPASGEKLKLGIDLSHLHIFDAQTKLSIY